MAKQSLNGPYSTPHAPIPSIADYYAAVLSQKWETDFKKAFVAASQKKQAVLCAFEGLTWCGPCQQLDAEVFKTFTFLQWTYGRVVLLRLDYAQDSKQWNAQQTKLMAQYKIIGFPSILGLDPKGVELGRVVGYSIGRGPAPWIASFETATGLT